MTRAGQTNSLTDDMPLTPSTVTRGSAPSELGDVSVASAMFCRRLRLREQVSAAPTNEVVTKSRSVDDPALVLSKTFGRYVVSPAVFFTHRPHMMLRMSVRGTISGPCRNHEPRSASNSLFGMMWFLSVCGTTSEPCRNHAAVRQVKSLL